MLGADPAQLRDLAKDFAKAATDLTTLSASLSARVNRPGGWNGPDAEDFRRIWNSQHRPRIASANSCLQDAAKTLLRNAEEQEKASSVAGSGGIPGLPGFPGLPGVPGSPWTPVVPGGQPNFIQDLLTSGVAVDAGLLGTLYASLVGGTNGLNLAGVTRLAGSFDSLESAMKFSKLAGAMDTLDVFAGGKNWGALTQQLSQLAGDGALAGKIGTLAGPLATIGKTLGPAGAALGWLSVGTDIASGNVARGVYDGVGAALGTAALLTPPPVDLALGVASGAMALGGLLYDKVPFVHDTVDVGISAAKAGVGAIADAAGEAAGAVADGAKDFANGVADTAKKLWPF